MTRAEAVQLLSRMTNADPNASYPMAGFSDVQSDAYYANALNAFAYGGIVDVDTSYFRPYAPITRAEFVAMMYRPAVIVARHGSMMYLPKCRMQRPLHTAPIVAG